MNTKKRMFLIFLGCLAMLALSKMMGMPILEKAARIGIVLSIFVGVASVLVGWFIKAREGGPLTYDHDAFKEVSLLHKYDYSTYNIHRHDD